MVLSVSMTTCTCTRVGQRRGVWACSVTEASAELYLVFRVGVHGSDFQEVEGDLHLATARSKFSSYLHAKDRCDDISFSNKNEINKRCLVQACAEDKSGDE